MLNNLETLVNNDKSLVWRGRWVTLSFIFGLGEIDFIITIVRGKVTNVKIRQLATQTGTFSIRAAESTWLEHWTAIPKRNYHDIWSMLPKQLITLDGNLLPLIQNLQFFKDLIASPRDGKD